MSDALAVSSGVTMAVQVSGLDAVLRLSQELGKAGTGAVPAHLAGKPSAIAAVLMTAAEMRIGPMEALRGIHMIEGKATLSSGLMLAQAMRCGVRVQWLKKDATGVRARFTRSGYPDHEESYTIEEAKTAGLAGRGTWAKHPIAMLTARCVSRALVSWAPDVLGAGVYVEGEIEAEQTDRRDTIEAEVVAAKPAADPLAEEVGRIAWALDAAVTEQAARDAWRLTTLIWRKLSPEQIATLEAAKARAKGRISPPVVDHYEAAEIARAEREEAAQ